MARLLPLAILIAILLAQSAQAQEAPDPSWTLVGTVGVLSDYRYRGYSLSDEQPALQAGMTLGHASGVYGDVYVSTIDEYGVGGDGDGAHVEATLTLGWAGSVRDFDVDVGLAAYQYPDGSDVSYYELPVQVGQTRGPLTWTLGAAWAPEGQAALGRESNRYVWGGLDFAPEAWPVSMRGTLGFEDGAYAPDGKTDWLIGMAIPVGDVSLGLDYVDSDADEGALVASLFVTF
jgi:uncharacterized protein (TIGR02001 family)